MLRASVSQQISSCFAQSSSRSHFETGLFPFKRFGDENPDWSCDHSDWETNLWTTRRSLIWASISLLILKWEQNSGFNLELIVEGFHLNVCNSLIWYQCHIPQKPLLLSKLLLGTIMLTACFIAIRSVSCENCRKGSFCLFDILLGPTWFPLLTLWYSWCPDICLGM